MRFHVVALPHTNTTSKFLTCAYTAKTINFCRMMKDRGHTVFLYGGLDNEAPCDEHIPCVAYEERIAHVGRGHYTEASFDYSLPFWRNANSRVIEEISKRSEKRDFICLIAGLAQKQIADALPHMMAVEYGVGYPGTFTKKRVFESYAWMHMVYGAESMGAAQNVDGNWWDAVIPGYLDPDMFPFEDKKDDYMMYLGRITDRKGVAIATQVCEKIGKRLVMAGPGTPPPGVDYRGVVGPEERGKLLSKAQALFVPTMYIEPFGNVHVEAMMCGTPVITTDWGVFTETVVDGVNGFRCRTFSEFLEAAAKAPGLDAHVIRSMAYRFRLEEIAKKYEQYFERLLTLWDPKGWYHENQ